MVHRIDLQNKKLGSLLVLSYSGDKKWLCKCDCGVERIIYSSSLRNGKTHCGCKGIKFPNRFKDLNGLKFGRLKVIYKDPNLRKKRCYWICKCDCNNEISVRGAHLISGNVKSCGCINSEDLVSKKFGKLTVVKDSGKRAKVGRSKIWIAVCDCGKEKFCSTSALKKGISTHCGCLFKDRILDFEKAKVKSLLSTYKCSAKYKKLCFSLTESDIKLLTESNCFYCNGSPENVKYMHRLKGEKDRRQITYQGIDRVDSKKGYEKNNAIPCCHICNIMKNSLLQTSFFEHIKKILNHVGSFGT